MGMAGKRGAERGEATEALQRCGLFAPHLGSSLRALGQIPTTNASKAPLDWYQGPELETGPPTSEALGNRPGS